jgi:flagellar assembly protein FliH
MPSSKQGAATAPPRSIATYAFEQLSPPPDGAGKGAADVLSAAWAEAEQVRAQARLAGEAEGRAAGLAAARAESEQALQALASGLESVGQLRYEIVAAIERDAVELSLRLCEQILSGVLSVEPERVLDVARGALRRLAERHRVTVVVNPADLDLLTESAEGLRAELGGIEHLGIQTDRRVRRGGAIVRTEAGEIDATLDTQLGKASEIIAAALAEHAADDD